MGNLCRPVSRIRGLSGVNRARQSFVALRKKKKNVTDSVWIVIIINYI